MHVCVLEDPLQIPKKLNSALLIRLSAILRTRDQNVERGDSILSIGEIHRIPWFCSVLSQLDLDHLFISELLLFFSIFVNKRRDSSNSLFLFGTETIRFDQLFTTKLLLFSQFLSIGGTWGCMTECPQPVNRLNFIGLRVARKNRLFTCLWITRLATLQP